MEKNGVEMAEQGLRTLFFAYKEIKGNWKNMPDEQLESDLHLLGVTGVEDKLQVDVKHCISDFRHSGIKVWMLTGDAGITAKQIGL